MFAGEGGGFNALRQIINHNAEILRDFMTQFAADVKMNIPALIAVSERKTADHIAEFNGRVDNLSSRFGNLDSRNTSVVNALGNRITVLDRAISSLQEEQSTDTAIKQQVEAHELAIERLHVEMREGTSGVCPRLEVVENRMRLHSETLESLSMISSRHETELRGFTNRVDTLGIDVAPLQSAVKEHYDRFERVDQNVTVANNNAVKALGDIAVIERERARIEGQVSVLTSVIGHRS